MRAPTPCPINQSTLNGSPLMRANFDDWYSEQCSIDAAELEGPNSPEYDRLTERFYEDETRREAALRRYRMENGDCG